MVFPNLSLPLLTPKEMGQIDCNIFTFTVQDADSRRRLERDGHYHLGEVAVKLISGGINAQDAHELRMFEPEHLFFTSSGRIGVVMHVNDDIALDLTALQSNMAAEITGPGNVQHSKCVWHSHLWDLF